MNADPRPCARCGAEFAPLAGNVRKGWGRYCSRSCASRHSPKEKKSRRVNKDAFRSLWRRGMAVDELAAATGMSRAAIYALARRLGLPNRGRRRDGRWPVEDDEFRALWDARCRARDLAEYCGYKSQNCATDRARRMGLARRPHWPSHVSLDEARRRVAEDALRRSMVPAMQRQGRAMRRAQEAEA